MTPYEKAKQAVDMLFQDQSQSQAQTREDLSTLREHINNLIETLPDAEDTDED